MDSKEHAMQELYATRKYSPKFMSLRLQIQCEIISETKKCLKKKNNFMLY